MMWRAELRGKGLTPNSMRNLSSLREKVVLTLFRGGEQLAKLRRSPKRREQRIALQGGVCTVVSFDSAL